ncbi:hypothetical protein EUX98_g4970 [Antrodiella citrinella]|uniref:Uncharacterized protein n=1 Tax=Antrodiella citrinella TaxID=2447956 RepID=A0A4S4MSS3_9APHY|nr:hypothetical protein EUX98_g4970 [Antrodiella citrinella]
MSKEAALRRNRKDCDELDPEGKWSKLCTMLWGKGDQAPLFEAVVIRRSEGEDRVADAVPSRCWVLSSSLSEVGILDDMLVETAIIREEYLTAIDDMINVYVNDTEKEPRKTKRWLGHTVTGQPGIGKSVLLIIILILRLAAGLPTVLIDQADYMTLFIDGKVYSIPMAPLRIIEFFPRHLWILFDSNHDVFTPRSRLLGSYLFLVQAASPRNERIAWRKKSSIHLWYMKTWTLVELLLGRQFQRTGDVCEEVYLKLYWSKYAPSARLAYKYGNETTLRRCDKDTQNQIKRLSYDNLYKVFQDASAHHLQQDISYHLIRFDPDGDRDPIVKIPTQHLCDMIYSSVLKGSGPHIANFYSLFLETSYSKWRIEPLERSFTRKYTHWRTYDDATFATEYLSIKCSDRGVATLEDRVWKVDSLEEISIKPYNAKSTLDLQSAYYAPMQKNHPSFDSFLFDAVRGLAIGFQATVGDRHDVKLGGLSWL